MALVGLDQARAHLRVGSDYPADQVQLYLDAAEEQAAAFLNRQVYATPEAMAEAVLAGTAGADPMVANKSVMAAILLILGHLFVNRADTVDRTAAKLPMGSRSLLQPWRVDLGL